MSQRDSTTEAAASGAQSAPGLAAWAPWLIVLVTCAAYATSFRGTFVLDDMTRIVANPNVQQFQGPHVLIRDVGLGRTRPLVLFTLQANYALSGLETWSYHLVNLVIHVSAALVLYALVRRTLAGPRAAMNDADATRLALAIAAIWAVHPLTTQAVTYIIQRCESLAGLLYLAAVYAFARGAELAERPSAARDVQPGHWYALAVVAVIAGILSKEVVCTAPVVILVYDWLFWARGGRDIWRRRGFYLALALTPLVYMALAARVERVPDNLWSAYFQRVVPADYLLTQAEVVAHYLRLAIFPYPLCFDYAWPPATSLAQVAVPGAIVLALLLATLFFLVRRSPWAFPGVWFFAILAPTSSIVPIFDLAVEHRMYLPLISVVAVVVLAIDETVRRLASGDSRVAFGAACTALVLVLAAMTAARNLDYRDRVTLWSSVARVRPDNPRAQYNLGLAWVTAGNADEAIKSFERALQILPDFEHVHFDLGSLLLGQGQAAEAEPHLRAALARHPRPWLIEYQLGLVCRATGRSEEAVDHFRRAVEAQGDFFEGHTELGVTLAQLGRVREALPYFERAAALKPDSPDARNNLAIARRALGQS